MSTDFWSTLVLPVVLAVFGLAGTWYLGNKSIQRKLPTWTSVTLNEVTQHVSHVEGLEVLYRYKGQDVPQLSRSNVAYWNAGGVAIRATDEIPKAPLTLTVQHGYQLLDIILLQNTDEDNNFTVHHHSDDTFATITFDYLAARHGVVMLVIHTGLTDDDIDMSGNFIDAARLERLSLADRDVFDVPETWKRLLPRIDISASRDKSAGASKGVRVDTEYMLTEDRRVMRNGAIFLGAVGTLLSVLILSLTANGIRHMSNIHTITITKAIGVVGGAFLLIFFGLIAIVMVYLAWQVLQKVRRIPPDLDIFQGIITELRAAASARERAAD